jgi:nickel/cobalt transporter (NiCoT) family protein
LGQSGICTIGIGVLAYTCGLRHAFDADPIAAVDNTTRKLLTDRAEGGRRPLSVGFWFSLGHSTIVFLLALLLSAGVKALTGQVEDDGSALHSITGVIGASVSGVFLWVIGIFNLVVLLGIVGIFRRMRRGQFDEAELEAQLINVAYGWAFAKPVRKVFYNIITITAISVAVALIIGTIELIGVLVDQAGIDSGPLADIADIPLDYAGYGIVALFVIAWLAALAVWHFGRIEDRWSQRLREEPAES